MPGQGLIPLKGLLGRSHSWHVPYIEEDFSQAVRTQDPSLRLKTGFSHHSANSPSGPLYPAMVRTLRCALLFPVVLFALPSLAPAQAPPTYYNSVDDSTPATLRSTLHNVIDDHTRFPYTSGSTDTWDILEIAQEDPGNSSRIIDIYRNASYAKIGGGVGAYNREHSWPSSYGFPDDGSDNYPYTDCHQLFLCDSGYNSTRSNKPFRNCSAGCAEVVTLVNCGNGGGSGTYPGNSNWTSGAFTQGTWQVWSERRGDIARAMFYADIRYEGGSHGVTGHNEPNLILTNNESLIDNSNTGNNESVAYMGMLSVLLQWHIDDPVDAKEMTRNDVVFSFQGNRNPFVDHPEWVDCIYNGNCSPDMTPPAVPTGLTAIPGSNLVTLDWNDNTDPDLAGYRVFRSLFNGGPYSEISGGLVTSSFFNDATAMNGTEYFYVVTAEDLSGNQSFDSLQASATPMAGGGGGDAWINEIHYENLGPDVGEFVEIAGAAGLSLFGYDIVGYNGNGGTQYATLPLAGVIPDQGGCMGTLSFLFANMQNGGTFPDGLALVDPMGQVVEFLSYEGTFTATNGPAVGLQSVNIGVQESSTAAAGLSLQLAGAGMSAGDFSWQAPQAETPGAPNTGQLFTACATGTGTPFCFGDGSGTGCPCGNNSTSGHMGGCANSVGDGAMLIASGDPSVANDTLSITLVNGTPISLGVLFSGNNQLGGGNGILGNPPTDGLRCIGGGLRRHGNRSIGAGGSPNSPWGLGGGPMGGLIANAGFTAGQVRHFAVTYRDFDTLVCNTGLNTTNAITITMVP